MPTVQLSEQETKDLAKKAGGKALELGKKGLATGKQALNEVHKAGMFELKNFKEYNSSLVHMINIVKGEVTSVQGGQRTAQDAVVSALTFKSNDPEGGFKFMCGALPAPPPPRPHPTNPTHRTPLVVASVGREAQCSKAAGGRV